MIKTTKSQYIKCPVEGCMGDARYMPPGRGHKEGCAYGFSEEDLRAISEVKEVWVKGEKEKK